MKSTMKDVLCITCISLLLLLIYTVCDILDLPSRIGIPVQYINWDAAGLLCGNLVVIALFVITYRALDKRSIQKEHNRRKVALYILSGTILACKDQIQQLKDPSIMESILKKIDFDKAAKDDPNYNKLLTLPFSNHDTIVSLATEGVLSEAEFSAYNQVRIHYDMLIICLITYHDVDALKRKTEAEFSRAISQAETTIKRGNLV